MEKTSTKADVIFSIVAYSFCSGSMLLVNKLVLHQIPYAATVVVIQLIATTLFVLGGKQFQLFKVDDLEWRFVKPYLLYVVGFTLGVYCNMRALAASNVETVIVFRSCTPLVVSLLEYLFLGRELPGRRSLAALSVIALGAVSYMLNDSQFAMEGWAAYLWVTMYFAVICFEMTYGKRIVSQAPLKTNSGPVLYTNLLSMPAMALFVLGNNELPRFHAFLENDGLTTGAALLLALSCVVGTGISYSGWYCRSKVSAASFTVVGVMNKCITVLANILIWDKHASTAGILSLLVCLVGGSFYEQAPMRQTPVLPTAVVDKDREAGEDVGRKV